METKIKRSVCPYDCPDTCGLLVTVENGRATAVAGDSAHPFTRGALCPKMTHYERTVNSPDRLTRPLLRTGPKGSGEFRPISWPEAIDRIAGQWRAIIAAHGAEAILPYSYAGTMGLVQRNAGHAFFHRLGAARLERTICSSSKDVGWKAVMGNTLAMHPDEAKDSDLIILWSLNAVATNIHFLRNVREAQKRGARVWLIDTYETPTARFADRVFLTRPGADAALALGIMHVMVRDGLVDKAFIEKYVHGYDEFAGRILPSYPPAAVSALTGLPAEVIEELARGYAAAKAPLIRLGSGLCRYGNGSMTVRAVACLPALAGAWAKRGGGLLASIATGGAFDTTAVTREDFITAPTRIVNMNKLGDALTELAPPVMSLYVYHSNPAAITPDQNKVLAGLAREDLFTVVHERFMTDTARYADIILPATTSLEHSDIYRAYGHYCVQRAYPVIAPVGEAKANWDVFRLLASAMGFNDEVFARSADDLIDELLAQPTPWLAQTDLAALRDGQAVELPLPPDAKLTFGTASGKIELLNPADPEPLPRYLPPHGDDAPLWLMTAPTPIMLNSSFCERADLLDGQSMTLKLSPADAAARGLSDGQRVVAFNNRGEVAFILAVTPGVPTGVAVAEGVWWIKDAPGDRTVNALTSQRLTDRAAGSTFYDTKVDVRAG
ncbi:molybdopterin-dependent oxidoreductase [Anaeroselena agilis]|uniref:Molybdopterin-dependent oxidoreductase n=1 Tax=Anaeroselena agilis TaxID=3063788 RepID=A0ABU3P0P2_9FIRM|nr:molybdopterin-dependent oxidoreductase [Selenomonadales bacterium 4137-cl]